MDKSISYYENQRPEIVSLIPKNIRTILDIGCGEGIFLKNIKDLTRAETWGVEMVAELEEKIRENADHCLIGKAEDIIGALPDNYFDCITLNDVLEHLLEPTELLRLIKPKLSTNGVVVASIPNVRFFTNLRALVIDKDWKYNDHGILDSTHFRFFTKISMKRMFEEAGYEVVLQKGLSKLTSPKTKLFNILTCSFFEDTRYMQYANVAKVRKLMP